MNELFDQSRKLLSYWKGDKYIFGRNVLPQAGELVSRHGKKALVICNASHIKAADTVSGSLEKAGVSISGNTIFPGAGPNAPRGDVYRIETYILHHKPDVIVVIGGGSAIDACKASNLLACLGGDFSADIDYWFGTGKVSEALKSSGKKLLPVVAIQTSASSGAHLTKYSNITDMAAGQKKLIVDNAIVPPAALFDYDLTKTMPVPVTVDGILDSVAHCFEVFSGLPMNTSCEKYNLLAEISEVCMELVFQYAPKIIRDPGDMEARKAIGMASDLGGYAIMEGGTHGPHMNSFSLVNLTGHGTACGIMNPYYAILFAPVIDIQLKYACRILKKYGFTSGDPDKLKNRDLGIEFANGMIAFYKKLNAPAALGELPGWNDSYVDKILTAAKDPQLEMKLKNMPYGLDASRVDEYLGPVVRAAVSGDFSLIKTLGM